MARSLPPQPPAARPLPDAAVGRRPAATGGAGALLAAGAAALLLTPRAAAATAGDDLYEACLDAVTGLAEHCLKSSDTFLGDLACMWAGGVGYVLCAASEAIRHLLPGGLNIS